MAREVPLPVPSCTTPSMTAIWSPRPGGPTPTPRGAGRAARRGVRMAVVSNIGWDLRPVFRAHGLDPLVDAYVLSYEHGVQKPDPRLFRAACDALGVDPARGADGGRRPPRGRGGGGPGLRGPLRGPSPGGPSVRTALRPVLGLTAGLADRTTAARASRREHKGTPRRRTARIGRSPASPDPAAACGPPLQGRRQRDAPEYIG